MPPESKGTDWNFKRVYEVLPRISTRDVQAGKPSDPALGNLNTIFDLLKFPREGKVPALPDYVKQEKAAPALEPFGLLTAKKQDENLAYASDGALYYPPSQRGSNWAPEINDPGHMTSVQPPSPPAVDRDVKNQQRKKQKKTRAATKNQQATKHSSVDLSTNTQPPKKKESMKQGKKNKKDSPKGDIAAGSTAKSPVKGDVLKSEVQTRSMAKARGSRPSELIFKDNGQSAQESATQGPTPKQTADYTQPPEKKASKSAIPRIDSKLVPNSVVQSPRNARSQSQALAPSTPVKKAEPRQNGASKLAPQAPQIDGAKAVSKAAHSAAKAAASKERSQGFNGAMKRTNSDVPSHEQLRVPIDTSLAESAQAEPSTPKRWPAANPFAALQSSFAQTSPSSTLDQIVTAANQKAWANVILSSSASLNASTAAASAAAGQPLAHTASSRKQKVYHQILPLENLEYGERLWKLHKKIFNRFPESKRTMLAPLSLSVDQLNAKGVHVFIDASNILIGYHEQLKKVRKIPEQARLDLVYPSFASLALLLERRRPVAKRVLAGSTPYVPVYDEAKASGYELCILEKVLKARELTERQKYFAIRDLERRNGTSGGSGGNTSGASTGSAVVLPPPKQKWVEQGVDEVLNNKMGESLADTPAPAENAVNRPTAILATGDAREAEYSSGFGAWVKRMLDRGWNVEVAAWSGNISTDYYRLERDQGYKGTFRLIKLDEFAEELFPPDDESEEA